MLTCAIELDGAVRPHVTDERHLDRAVGGLRSADLSIDCAQRLLNRQRRLRLLFRPLPAPPLHLGQPPLLSVRGEDRVSFRTLEGRLAAARLGRAIR
mgnify:CR=1 FL=1